MRFLEDKDLSFCLTASRGIDKGYLLHTLGVIDTLVLPQSFDDFVYERHSRGRNGILNVFQEGDLLITLENSGYSGARRRIVRDIAAEMTAARTRPGGAPDKLGHYACLHRSTGDDGYLYYAEVQDGTLLGCFDPAFDEIPEIAREFIVDGGDTLENMIKLFEYRMETTIKPEWLDLQTETHVVDYLARHDRERD